MPVLFSVDCDRTDLFSVKGNLHTPQLAPQPLSVKASAFSHVAMDSPAQSVNILETLCVPVPKKIYRLDFCSHYNFYIVRFSQSGEGVVEVYRFMSKHSSNHYVRFCQDPFCMFCHTIHAPLCMKLMHTRTHFKLHFLCFFLLQTIWITINRMCRSITVF